MSVEAWLLDSMMRILRLRLLGAVLSLAAPGATSRARNSIVISTRNALTNDQVEGVRVDYYVQGSRLGAIATGQNGIAVMKPRYHCCA